MTCLLGEMTRQRFPMGLLMARCAESDQILGSVIALSASPPNVMNLKTVDASTRLATPAVSL